MAAPASVSSSNQTQDSVLPPADQQASEEAARIEQVDRVALNVLGNPQVAEQFALKDQFNLMDHALNKYDRTQLEAGLPFQLTPAVIPNYEHHLLYFEQQLLDRRAVEPAPERKSNSKRKTESNLILHNICPKGKGKASKLSPLKKVKSK